MTSLCPGTIFSFPGFNRKSTPTPPTVTKDQLSHFYKREAFNGRPWPHSSPVAGVYDIGFTSTKMIIYNNKRKRYNKLRGKNDPSMDDDVYPDPERHSRCSTPVNKDQHTRCYDSSSPYFSPSIKTDLEWANYEQRPPFTYEDGRMVNPKHHTSCAVPSDPVAFRLGMKNPSRRPTSRTSLPAKFQTSPLLTHPELRRGEKEYLHSIARIYDVGPMINLKQEQYNKLLSREREKGLYTSEEVKQYRQFINLGRKRQYLRPQGNRIMSAPLIKMLERDDRERVKKQTQAQKEKTGDDEKRTGDDEKRTGDDEKRDDNKETGSPSSPEPTNNETKNMKKTSKSDTPKSSSPEKSPKKHPTSVQRPVSSRSSKSSVSSKSSQSSKTEKVRTPRSPRKQEKTNKSKESDSSDTSESVSSSKDRRIHREGFDRPRTRLGHISEDSRSRKSQEENAQESTGTPNDRKISQEQDSSQPEVSHRSEEDSKVTDNEKDVPPSARSIDNTNPEQSSSNDDDLLSPKSSLGSKPDEDNKKDTDQKGDKLEETPKYQKNSDSEDEIEQTEKVNKDPDTLEY